MEDMKKGLLQAITSRRSIRSYRPEPLGKELLDEVIEAGRLAPSGNNSQTTHFIVITKPDQLAELRRVVTEILANTPVRDDMPPPMVGLINRAKKGEVDVAYGAPVLIITANKKGYGNAMADCSCALENMMLMAAADRIGSCWINQYYHLRNEPSMRACLEKLGLAEDEEVCGALALGYTDQLETTPLPRKGNPVTFA